MNFEGQQGALDTSSPYVRARRALGAALLQSVPGVLLDNVGYVVRHTWTYSLSLTLYRCLSAYTLLLVTICARFVRLCATR